MDEMADVFKAQAEFMRESSARDERRLIATEAGAAALQLIAEGLGQVLAAVNGLQRSASGTRYGPDTPAPPLEDFPIIHDGG